jgi:hypothetical protein
LAKEIPLTQGKFAIVDDDDYERVSQFKWCYDKKGYAVRGVTINGKHTTQSMHRFIMNCPPGYEVDHKNGNGLDNRKENLRICTKAENVRNNYGRSHNTSGYKGVYWHKKAKKWAAQLTTKGKNYHLGLYDNKEDAARAYNKKALELFGEFARINVIKGDDSDREAV